MARDRQRRGVGGKLPRLAFAVCLAVLPGLLHSSEAAAAATTMHVMARVLTFFRVQVGHQAPALTVTAGDIERGYVEVATATDFSVVTNSEDGFVVDFRPRSDIFRSVFITGLPFPVEIGAQGGSALYNLAHGRTTSHHLSYRFLLRADLQPGSYGWPLEISVRSA